MSLPLDALKLITAPMVDQSDLPFRILCRRYGATLTYTQMFMASDLISDQSYRREILEELRAGWTAPFGRPVAVQLAGNDPETIVEAARLVEPYCDAIDLNLGCPQKKAELGHFGGYLILSKADWRIATSIVSGLSQSLTVPIFVKMRLCSPVRDTVTLAKELVSSGASVVCLHARYVSSRRRRKGAADLNWVAQMKKTFQYEGISAQVISNGNVRVYQDIQENLKITGADGVMMGEAALGNPKIFSASSAVNYLGCIDLADEYLTLCENYPDTVTLKHVRQHVKSFFAYHDFIRNTLLVKQNKNTRMGQVRG
ncbi:FMN-linked oxidoreductase [Sistotremastrum niveocremeum HHB9708]|uniref:tRNA-dihydrouridine synthase n=1 Tax=Sistotremastrum niveocremeum HHB9708 TaxID=1314777 RepID=A0A165AJK9_9AGAM|nr:FMN-linked oxidoreductase [Sistotremastrum niveocremeum HHB9708]